MHMCGHCVCVLCVFLCLCVSVFVCVCVSVRVSVCVWCVCIVSVCVVCVFGGMGSCVSACIPPDLLMSLVLIHQCMPAQNTHLQGHHTLRVHTQAHAHKLTQTHKRTHV